MAKTSFVPPAVGTWLMLASVLFTGYLAGACNKEETPPLAATTLPSADTQPATLPAATVKPLPRSVTMRIGTGTFTLEVAENNHDRQQGLMYRESMPHDHGMIFVFGTEEDRAFYMKNTLIPLDLIYLNASGKVISIMHGEPLREEPTIPSLGPAKWTIELNYGVAAAANLKVGDNLIVPAEARVPQED